MPELELHVGRFMYLLIKPESLLCGHLVVHFASQEDLVACQPHLSLHSNVFLCNPGTILWEPPYLIHGFARHHHGRMFGLLSALQLLSLHFRHDTMRVTVLEPWLCACHRHGKMLGLLSAFHFFSLRDRDYTMGYVWPV